MNLKLVFLSVAILCICHMFSIDAQKLKNKLTNAKNKVKNINVENVKNKFKKKFLKIGVNHCDCGISDIDENDEKQIHPWQVFLTINWKKKKLFSQSIGVRKRDDVFCQGTLISKKHIVTMAQCLQEIGLFDIKTRTR